MSRRRPYKRRPLPPLITAQADEQIEPTVIAPREPEWMPTLTLAKQVARARREMGEAKWAALNAEWN